MGAASVAQAIPALECPGDRCHLRLPGGLIEGPGAPRAMSPLPVMFPLRDPGFPPISIPRRRSSNPRPGRGVRREFGPSVRGLSI